MFANIFKFHYLKLFEGTLYEGSLLHTFYNFLLYSKFLRNGLASRLGPCHVVDEVVVAHAGSKVLVEVDDNSANIVANGKEATVNRALNGNTYPS